MCDLFSKSLEVAVAAVSLPTVMLVMLALDNILRDFMVV